MEEKETLLLVVKKYINCIKNSFEINTPQQFNEELYTSLLEKTKLIELNPNLLGTVDIEQIGIILPNFDLTELETLEFYKSIITSTSFTMLECDYDTLKIITSKISAELYDYIEKIKENKRERENKFNEITQKYQTIINKIENDFNLTSEEVKLIYEMLKSSNLEITKLIKLMRFIATQTLKESVAVDSIEEIQIMEDTNLSYKELEELFNKYNCSLSMFSKADQIELQKYGNIQNIKEIFNKLLQYNIKINEYLKVRSTAISKIFIYSNSQLIENIIEIFIKYNLVKRDENNNIVYYNGQPIVDFDILLGRPSQFLSRKKRWARRNNGGKLDETFEGPSGCQEDFIKNIEYFFNEGLDIENAYKKCDFCFYFPHEHILEVVKTFKLYGINKELYLKTLSSFATSNQADSIDMFIELDCLDYLKNNLSRFSYPPNSPMFYKLARAKQLNVTPQRYGKGLESAITYDSREYLGITKENGAKETKQYIFVFDGKEYFDKIIKINPNNSISVIIEEQKELISILDYNYIPKDETNYPDYRIYNINGITISRIKFLRILNTLVTSGINPSINSIMYALTKNSIVTKEQFQIIYDEISNLYNSRLHKEGEFKR